MKVAPQAEEQIVCRWCGLFSAPGPACDTCGSPLLDVPWMQVPQLAFQARPQAQPQPSDQPLEEPAAPPPQKDSERTEPSVSEQPLPAAREQVVQGLVVGGAALVYEDALEPPPSHDAPLMQAPAAPTDEVATARPVEPEAPSQLDRPVDVVSEAQRAPEAIAPSPPASLLAPPPASPATHGDLESSSESPNVDAVAEELDASVAGAREETRPAAGSRRWFLRRHPSAPHEPGQVEDSALLEPALAEGPGPQPVEVEELEQREPVGQVVDELDLDSRWAVPTLEDILPEAQPPRSEAAQDAAASEEAEEGPLEPSEDRPEERPRRRRGLLWKRPVPEPSEVEAEAEAELQAMASFVEETEPAAQEDPPVLARDEIAELAYPPAMDEVEPEPAVEELVAAPDAEETTPVPEVQEPAPRGRRWLRRRGAPSPEDDSAMALEAPEAREDMPVAPEVLEAPEVPDKPETPEVPRATVPPPKREVASPPPSRPAPAAAAPVVARPAAARPISPPPPPAPPADFPVQPAAASAPPVAPAEAQPQAPAPWTDQPYYVEASPEHVTPTHARVEPTPQAKPPLRQRLRRRRDDSPSASPGEASPRGSTPLRAPEAQASSPPAPTAAEEAPPSVSVPVAPATPRPGGAHGPPSPPQSPAPAPARATPSPPPAPLPPPPPPAPLPPPPPPAPWPAPPAAAPPAPMPAAAPPPTTSSWKSSTPEPPRAAAYSTGVRSGPSPVTTEITCPRCGEPSPRGLCETCEYALLELRELMIGLEQE